MRYVVHQRDLWTVLGIAVPDSNYTNDQPVVFVVDKGASGTDFRAMARCDSLADAQAIVDALNA